MNIALFTPIQVTSSVAISSKHLVNQLTVRGHRFVIVDSATTENDGKKFGFEDHLIVSHKNSGRIREALQYADAVCYHIGNDFNSVGGMLSYLSEFPGVVILDEHSEIEGVGGDFSSEWNSSKTNLVISGFNSASDIDALENALWNEVRIKFQSDTTRLISEKLSEWFPDGIPSGVIDGIGDSINALFYGKTSD